MLKISTNSRQFLGVFFILFFHVFSNCGLGNNVSEDGAYDISSEKSLNDFYKPCPFPCLNFTEAFFAEANAIWFSVSSIIIIPTANNNATTPEDQIVLRIEIKRLCRLDISGNFKSDHILVSAKEVDYILQPEVGHSYVAAVIPNEIHPFVHDYRLVTPLVPATEHFPWKHICRSCYFNNSVPSVSLDTYDTNQLRACSCPNVGEKEGCSDFVIEKSADVDIQKEYHQHAVLMTIIIVGVTTCGLFLLIGIAYWRWRKYVERRRIERSVVPRARGCQLDHPGPEVTGSPPPVPLTHSQLPITMPLLPISNQVIQEESQYRSEINREVLIDFNMTRHTSVTPLLNNNSPPDSPTKKEEEKRK